MGGVLDTIAFADEPSGNASSKGARPLAAGDELDSGANADGLRVFRAVHHDEIFAIRDIALEFHAESRYAHLPFSDQKFIRVFEKAMSRPNDAIALYVQFKGRTVGLLNAAIGDYYLGQGGRMATVYVMYVSGSIRGSFLGGKVGLRLLRMVSNWARMQGAGELHIHATSGIEPGRTDKLLKRLGFKVYGGNYAAAVPSPNN